MTVPVDSSVPTKVLFTDHTLLVFSIFFSIIDDCSYGLYSETV